MRGGICLARGERNCGLASTASLEDDRDDEADDRDCEEVTQP
jgi:hypothetical protein